MLRRHLDDRGRRGRHAAANDSYTVTKPAVRLGRRHAPSSVLRPIDSHGDRRHLWPVCVLNTLGGDDSVTVDVGGPGSDVIGVPITFDGGDGKDTLTVSGTPATAVNQVTYTPGPATSQGRLLYQNAGGATLMTIDVANLEPIVDLVPAVNAVVNGTNADNAINYTQGSVAGQRPGHGRQLRVLSSSRTRRP